MNSFKASINAKFDLGNKQLINNYIPTVSHLEAFENILLSSISHNHQNSHLIVGAYGTGKSYLATILAGILSNEYRNEELSSLLKKVEEANAASPAVKILREMIRAEDINQNNEGAEIDLRYLPVILSGYEGSFREAILGAVITTLSNRRIEIDLPGQNQQIMTVINRWKSEYPKAFKRLKEIVTGSEGRDFERFLADIQHDDQKSLDLFNSIYSEITFGESIRVDTKHLNFIQTLENILDQLNQQNLGIVLEYDEFGRFLQSLDTDAIYQTMQDLQDLAELANNGSQNFELILISHKDLNTYFEAYPDYYREEFKRIEGRFKTYFIKSDEKVFASIVKVLLNGLIPNRKIPEKDSDDYRANLRVYDLFNMGPDLIDDLIVEGSYPLHPVTLFTLSVLSSRFGQNERTLYTFFTDPQGISQFLSNASFNQIMYPDFLYDYFFSESESDPEISLYRRKIENNLAIIRDRSEATDLEMLYRIYKFVSLWEIGELSAKQELNFDFISFAAGVEKESAEALLRKLTEIGVLRLNRNLNRYETKMVSPINIEDIIQERAEDVTISEEELSKTVLELLPRKFFKAYDYNRLKDMTRYGQLDFNIVSDLKFLEKDTENNLADASIRVLVADQQVDPSELLNQIQNKKDDNVIYCLAPIDLPSLKSDVKKLKTIKKTRFDHGLLREYPGIKDEINYLEEDTVDRIKAQLNLLTKYSEANQWMLNGEKLAVADESSLSALISKLMFDLYPKTPIVLNESFNKNKISAVQKKAAIKVVDRIFESEEVTGNGPDYLIHYSVFTANQYDPINRDRNSDSPLLVMENELKGFLKKHSNLSEVVEFFKKPEYGYGIRSSLIPVLFSGLLKDVWDNLLFFSHGSSVMNLNGENLFKMFENPEEFTFKYHTYSERQTKIIHEILNRYGFSQEDKGKPNHMKAGHGLYLWLKSLPRYSQISFEVPEELVEFRDAVDYFSVDPIGSIDRLANIGIEGITDRRIALDSFILQKQNEIRNELYSALDVKDYSHLQDRIRKLPDLIQLSNKLAKVILSSNQERIISDLSEMILGIPIVQWSDNTLSVFNREIQKEIRQLNEKPKIEQGKIIEVAGKKQIIENLNNLSKQGENLSKRINAMIYAQNQRVSKDEMKIILYEILNRMLEEDV